MFFAHLTRLDKDDSNKHWFFSRLILRSKLIVLSSLPFVDFWRTQETTNRVKNLFSSLNHWNYQLHNSGQKIKQALLLTWMYTFKAGHCWMDVSALAKIEDVLGWAAFFLTIVSQRNYVSSLSSKLLSNFLKSFDENKMWSP